jgi:hypothetical protein
MQLGVVLLGGWQKGKAPAGLFILIFIFINFHAGMKMKMKMKMRMKRNRKNPPPRHHSKTRYPRFNPVVTASVRSRTFNFPRILFR